MATTWAARLTDVRQLLRKAGPYLALEMVLPGGTLLALLLYLYRSGKLRDLRVAQTAARALNRAVSGPFDQLAYVWQPAALG